MAADAEAVDNDTLALARRLQAIQAEPKLSDGEVKVLRKVVKTLEAVAVMGRAGRWLIAGAGIVSACVLGADAFFRALRGLFH